MSFFQSFQQQLQQTTQQLSSTIQENLNNLSLQETAQNLSNSVQQNLSHLEKEVNNFKPILQRTTRSLQEKWGSIDDISELPQEYKDLERQVDNLKAFYERVLAITQQYEIESYDYPPNLRESLNDYTELLNEKITGLSQATTTQEAEHVLLSGRKDKIPKTFSHQLSKALKTSRDGILANKPINSLSIGNNPSATEETTTESNDSIKDNALTVTLLKISEVEFKLGDERLEQDKLVITEFNNKVRTLLKQDISKCSQLRKQVETARLSFDTIRAEIKALQNGDTNIPVPEDLSKKLELCEDDLVSATEVAVEAMKELIKPVESVNLLKVLCKIQLNYHKNVVNDLSSLIDDLETVPLENDEDNDE